MGLGLQTGGAGGDIKPFIKYDARAGRVFRVDRSQNASGQFESNEVDITRDCAFIADLANVRVGWVNYTTQGPIQRMVILGKNALPPRPTDTNSEGKPAFKQGFEIDILLAKACGGGPARKFGSSAGCVIEAVDVLHDAFTASPEAQQGKLPIVKLVDTKAVKAGQSTNYRPTFEIAGWVDRPADLMAASAKGPNSHPQSSPASAPPATGATAVPPPAARPVPQPAAAMSAGDFG